MVGISVKIFVTIILIFNYQLFQLFPHRPSQTSTYLALLSTNVPQSLLCSQSYKSADKKETEKVIGSQNSWNKNNNNIRNKTTKTRYDSLHVKGRAISNKIRSENLRKKTVEHCYNFSWSVILHNTNRDWLWLHIRLLHKIKFVISASIFDMCFRLGKTRFRDFFLQIYRPINDTLPPIWSFTFNLGR